MAGSCPHLALPPAHAPCWPCTIPRIPAPRFQHLLGVCIAQPVPASPAMQAFMQHFSASLPHLAMALADMHLVRGGEDHTFIKSQVCGCVGVVWWYWGCRARGQAGHSLLASLACTD